MVRWSYTNSIYSTNSTSSTYSTYSPYSTDSTYSSYSTCSTDSTCYTDSTDSTHSTHSYQSWAASQSPSALARWPCVRSRGLTGGRRPAGSAPGEDWARVWEHGSGQG